MKNSVKLFSAFMAITMLVASSIGHVSADSALASPSLTATSNSDPFTYLYPVSENISSTPLEELYVLYRKIDELLREKGLVLHRPYVGRYACSMEMQGMSLSLMKLDDELKRLLDAPADSPFFKQF